MFKVRTGQTNIPMSQLAICSEPPQPRSPASPASSETPVVPKLLPAPVLEPTAYSARMILPSQMPSSPPASQHSSPEDHSRGKLPASEEVFRTPALPKRKSVAVADCSLSSPPDSLQRATEKGRGQDDVKDLTSSAIRGSAARGLLGLMQGS